MVSNTATVTSDGGGGAGGNNSSTVSNLAEAIQDGSFEDGSPNSFWAEASTNFGTPVHGRRLRHGHRHWPAHRHLVGLVRRHRGTDRRGPVTQSVTFLRRQRLPHVLPRCHSRRGFGSERLPEVTGRRHPGLPVDATSPLCNTVGYQQQTVDLLGLRRWRRAYGRLPLDHDRRVDQLLRRRRLHRFDDLRPGGPAAAARGRSSDARETGLSPSRVAGAGGLVASAAALPDAAPGQSLDRAVAHGATAFFSAAVRDAGGHKPFMRGGSRLH